MKRIDWSNLRKGDILLTTQAHPTSKVIRTTTKSDISHAMLYVADGSVMDSTGEGVHARSLQREIFDDSCAIHVYRSRAEIDAESMDQIVAYARSETGAPYATWEAVRSPFKPKRKGNDGQFCSRFVARAYASAGFALTDNPDFTTPADLQRSPQLERIEALILGVAAHERVELEDDDSVDGMRKVTNDLLKRVRAISPAIRVLGDLPPFLLSNPTFDDAIAEAHRASGFLDYWQVEVARNPHRYDPVAMVQLYQVTPQKAELLLYCRATLKEDAANGFGHWRVNRDVYAALLKVKPLETFQLNHDLYRTLCFNHDRRIKAATILLNAYGDWATT